MSTSPLPFVLPKGHCSVWTHAYELALPTPCVVIPSVPGSKLILARSELRLLLRENRIFLRQFEG